jgi:uncharacterized membrane protein
MPQLYGRPGFEHHHGDHRWLALLLFVLLLLALAALAVSAVRLAFGRHGKTVAAVGTPPDDALGTLRMRYARGEIDRDAFLLAHADLGGEPPPGASVV